MTADSSDNNTGTLLKGPGGAVYFISNARLEDFRLSDDDAKRALAMAEEAGDVEGHSANPGIIAVLIGLTFNPSTGYGDTFTRPPATFTGGV